MIYDQKFTQLYFYHMNKFVTEMCRICKAIAGNADLVQSGGADCFPDWLYSISQGPMYYPHCKGIKRPVRSTGQSKAKIMRYSGQQNAFHNSSLWAVMAFESVSF